MILNSEKQRLEALHALEILDTPDEIEYDQLVRLASQICETPVSLVSLVDDKRQWFKAALGLNFRQTPRDIAFCSHAICEREIFVVEDALKDERFRENALVADDPHIRFYAGVPIQAPNGSAIGTLCVIDTEPRTLREDQRQALVILGKQAQAWLELRHKNKVLERALMENKRLGESLHERNRLFDAFMDNGPFVSYIKDSAGRYVFFKSHLSQRFKGGSDAVLGCTLDELFPAEMAETHRRHDLEVLAAGVSKEFLESSPGPNGRILQWRSYKFPLLGADGEQMLAGISVDVTEAVAREAELAEATAQLQMLATTDALTGLANRRSFQARIEVEFALYLRKGRPLSLIILDLDNFKRRNDELGHAAGDRALAFVGEALRTTMRREDLPARLGGEEFAVLMPDTEADVAALIAARVQETFRSLRGAPENLTASIGVACAGDGSAQSWEELLSHADRAMYEAKRSGKNRIVCFEEHLPRGIFPEAAQVNLL